MSISSDKISYLKGLADGIQLSKETDEGKILLAIIDALSSVSSEKDQLESRVDKLGEYLDDLDAAVDEISGVIESEILGLDDTDEEDDYGFADEDDEEEEIDFSEGAESQNSDLIEVTCPHCGSYLMFSQEMYDSEPEHLCPSCNKPLFEDE